MQAIQYSLEISFYSSVFGIIISVLPSESAIIDSMRANQIDFALFNDPTIATLIPGEQGMTLMPPPAPSD